MTPKQALTIKRLTGLRSVSGAALDVKAASNLITSLLNYHSDESAQYSWATCVANSSGLLTGTTEPARMPDVAADIMSRHGGKTPTAEPAAPQDPDPSEPGEPTAEPEPVLGLSDAIESALNGAYPFLDKGARLRPLAELVSLAEFAVSEAVENALASQPAPQAPAGGFCIPAPTAMGFHAPEIWSEFCLIAKLSQTRRESYPVLVGPAGAGKSRMAQALAESLQMPFFCMSLSGDARAEALVGSIGLVPDGQGGSRTEHVPSGFVQAITAEVAHVVCLDEVFSAGADLVQGLNSVLSDGYLLTPGGVVHVNPATIFIGTANGTGRSESRAYAAVQRQDDSLVSRWQVLHVGYDPAVEKAMVKPLPKADRATILDRLAHVRQAVKTSGIVYDIGYRHLGRAVAYIQAGMSLDRAWDLAVLAPLSEGERRKVSV